VSEFAMTVTNDKVSSRKPVMVLHDDVFMFSNSVQ